MGAFATLLPLVLQLTPGLARYLGGTDAGNTAAQVVDVIRSVTGTDDPAQAVAAIKDPAVAAQVQIRLAEIQAARETDAQRAILADVASARAQTVALAQAGSPVQYGAVVVSLTVLATFGVVMWAALTRSLPEGSETVLTMLLGTLATMAGAVVQYWVGSSSGSADKTAMLARRG